MEEPCTPKRVRLPCVGEGEVGSERRRSLFGVSGVSPLSSPEQVAHHKSGGIPSPSWSEESPGKRSVLGEVTPRKSLENGFTQMALDRTPQSKTPLVTGRSPRVLGVRKLSPDRGVISPKTFYGKNSMLLTSSSDGKTLYERVRESVRNSVRVRLPMETVPRERKKPARSSPSSAQRPNKLPRYKLFQDDCVLGRKVTGRKRVDSRQSGQSAEKKNRSPYNWQFFNSQTPRSDKTRELLRSDRSASVLTPPPTSRKRKLLSLERDFLPGSDDERSCGKENEDLARAIMADFSEDENEEVLNTDALLENLEKDITEALDEVPVLGGGETVEAAADSRRKFLSLFKRSGGKERTVCPAAGVRKRRKVDPGQLLLDLGQKELRETVCPVCGLLYVMGDDSDETFHQDYHRKMTSLSMNSIKSARVVRAEAGGTVIIQVRPSDAKHLWKKAKEVLEVVDAELGFPPHSLDPTQVYLFIMRKEVVGVLAAQPLSTAHRLIPMEGEDMEVVTEEEYPVRVGISRIWVSEKHRKEGVASALVDSLRRNFTFGEILSGEDVAFSSPTADGKEFARKYCHRPDFLVYTALPLYRLTTLPPQPL